MKTGMTLAIFRSEGKTPVDKERLKIWARGKEMKGATCFTTEGLMSSKPELLPLLKVAIMSKISLGEVGLKKMDFSKGEERKSWKLVEEWI